MAEESQLERISGLVEQLGPLGGKRRGMRIEAEEWNSLVGALGIVLEIERAHERTDRAVLEDTAATRNRVDVIDAELQARLADGGASVSTRIALAEAVKRIDALGTEVARLTELVEAQRALLDRSAVDELERANALRGFEERFKGVEDLRGVVTTLGADVQGVRTGVDTVLELAAGLSDPQGNRIDVSALQNEVAALGALRTNLAGVDGELLRLRDFEVQIVELQDAVGIGGGAGLEGRIEAVRAELAESLGAKLEQDVGVLRTDLQAQGESTRAALQESLAAGIATARSDLEQLVATRGGELDARLDARFAEARAALDAQLAGVREELTASLPATVRAAVDGALADLDGRIGVAVDARLTTLDQRVAVAVDAALVNLPQTVQAQVAAQLPALREELMGQWRSELADTEGRLHTTVKETFTSLEERTNRRLEEVLAPIDERIRRLEGRIG